nr:hypothetical protein BaRGS_011587 [Batillaria attramentaria]
MHTTMINNNNNNNNYNNNNNRKADQTMDRKQRDMMNAFGLGAVKEWENPDALTVFIGRGENCPDWVLKRLETCTVMMYPLDQPDLDTLFWDTLSVLLGSATEGALREKASAFTDGLVQSAVKEWENPDALTVFIGRGENCPDWVLKRLETCTVMMYPLDQPDLDTLFWDTLSVLLRESCPDWVFERLETCIVVVYPGDHHKFEFFDGLSGLLSSDIILDVPPNAVEEDLQVTIHTAVCTDVDRVRRVLKLSEDECVSSPVAEYWAGHEFRFKKRVTITLPHFLPPDSDPSPDFGIKTDDKIGETLSFRLSNFQDDLHESSLHVHFELVGRDIDIWQFCLRSNGSPATPAEQLCHVRYALAIF